MPNTNEATDPIVRLESDLLRYCPSRSWEIRVVTFPTNPDFDVVVPHSLTVDTPEAVNYQVLQSNFPMSVYHAPDVPWTHSAIKLRSTAGGASATILLTVGKESNARLPLRDPSNSSMWTMGDFTFNNDDFSTVRNRVSSGWTVGADSLQIGGAKMSLPTGSGNITISFGSPGTLTGSEGMSSVFDRNRLKVIALASVSGTISADQNDYSPTGWTTASQLIVEPTGANRTLTGLDSTLAYATWSKADRIATVRNNSATYTLTLAHASASSAAANRFNLPFGADVVLGPGEAVTLSHNGTNWGLTGKNNRFANGVVTDSGVKFPATQVVSSDANTLDDYEEGTWTPVITGTGGSSGVTHSRQEGSYIKIGRLVYIRAEVVLSNKGSITGNIIISGLPFTTASSFPGENTGTIYWVDTSTAFTFVLANTQANATYTNLKGATGAVTSTVNLVTGDLTNTSGFNLSTVYLAAN
jgi:hypothetical protein